MDGQKPTVGRVVHYVAYGTPGGEFPAGVCRAALVTEVDTHTIIGHEFGPDETPSCGLFVANPTGCFFNQHVPYDAEKRPGSWHWPERV